MWVSQPHQRRSRQTLERIVAAAGALLERESYGRATVGEIVSEAGCSVGSFYARFKDKDALLNHIHARMCERSLSFSRQMLEPGSLKGSSLEEVLQRYVRLLVRNTTKNRGLLKAGLLLSAQEGGPYAQRAGQVEREIEALWTRLLRERQSEMSHFDPDRAAGFIQRLLRGALAGEVLLAHRPPDEGQLVRDLHAIVSGYLGSGESVLSGQTPPARTTG